ncbi:hypothetical protein ASZ90_016534 [hydrocarbon metagenome]|uniref:Uncharacterized protein n=1 Tax=hydrocarbon metagenome TaxID=938273 RepID=A0A0W8EPN5_9ZZZZ
MVACPRPEDASSPMICLGFSDTEKELIKSIPGPGWNRTDELPGT